MSQPPASRVPVLEEQTPQPQASVAVATAGLYAEIQELAASPLFWGGFAVKVIVAALFGSHFATRWFSPFVYEFVTGHFQDPWQTFLAKAEFMAFPYGPGMLAILTGPYLLALLLPFDPAGHLGLLLLRLPVLAADLLICVLLLSWLRMRAHDVIRTYWLNPIVMFASYVHGQLDLIPTALFCLVLSLTFQRRLQIAAAVFGVAIATKLHLLIAFPFVWIYVLRLRLPLRSRAAFGGIAIATAALLYLKPVLSPAFRAMVFGSPEAQRVWMLGLPFGDTGPLLYLCPAALLASLLRYASYTRLSRELVIMFLGLTYALLVALVPPMPGWFIWFIPFLAYHGARHIRSGLQSLMAITAAYLGYFCVSTPEVTFEALDPTFGKGTGAAIASALTEAAPAVFSAHGRSIAWTVLFTTIALVAIEFYRHGVQASQAYSFHDQTFMIGIAGDSASGKRTLATSLQGILGADLLTLVYGDDDHRWERGHPMWQRFTHLDPRGNLLHVQAEHLLALRRGVKVSKRSYDHQTGRFTETAAIKPTQLVAISGLHSFYLEAQRQALDLKIFLHPEETLRRKWKLARDAVERDHPPQQLAQEIERRVEDSRRFVKPQMQHADLVISAGEFDRARPEAAELRLEMATSLLPLGLLEVLQRVPTLNIDWSPDESLSRDRIVVRGEVGAPDLRRLARELDEDADQLVLDSPEIWRAGTHGLLQFVGLYGILQRLRG